MKIAGFVTGVVGFIMLMSAMYMDTTVAVSDVYFIDSDSDGALRMVSRSEWKPAIRS